MYIKISVNNKIATLQDNVLIINGNSDYVIKFDFDSEWDAYETKTARFVTACGYTDVVFSGDEVSVPVITDAISVRVGVYAGNLRTTTPAVIFCRRCITDGSGSPVEPTPDVYAQLMEMLNKDSGIWYPNVDDAGTISWVRSIAETEPTPINIKGPIGETGAQGSQGEKGPKGDTGDTGPTGPEGPQGPKGDAFTYADFTAEQLAALKGEKGDTGATGPQGPAGAPGKDGAGMDITGATVGQIAKIAAVDDTGKPTAWSPVDFPSGGSGGANIVCEQTELVSGIIPSGEAAWSSYDLGITLADIQEWEEIFVEFFGMSTISYWSFRPGGSNIPDASWIQGSSKQVYLFEWVDSEHTYIRVKSYAIGLGGIIGGILKGGLSSAKGSSVVCIADWSGVDPTAQMILLHNVATDADVTYKVWGITKKGA